MTATARLVGGGGECCPNVINGVQGVMSSCACGIREIERRVRAPARS
jgi:hypothetical protein